MQTRPTASASGTPVHRVRGATRISAGDDQHERERASSGHQPSLPQRGAPAGPVPDRRHGERRVRRRRPGPASDRATSSAPATRRSRRRTATAQASAGAGDQRPASHTSPANGSPARSQPIHVGDVGVIIGRHGTASTSRRSAVPGPDRPDGRRRRRRWRRPAPAPAASRRSRTRCDDCQRSAHDSDGAWFDPLPAGRQRVAEQPAAVAVRLRRDGARVAAVERLGAWHVAGALDDDRAAVVVRVDQRRPAGAGLRWSASRRTADHASAHVVQVGSAGQVGLPVAHVAAPRRQAAARLLVRDRQRGRRHRAIGPAVVAAGRADSPPFGSFGSFAGSCWPPGRAERAAGVGDRRDRDRSARPVAVLRRHAPDAEQDVASQRGSSSASSSRSQAMVRRAVRWRPNGRVVRPARRSCAYADREYACQRESGRRRGPATPLAWTPARTAAPTVATTIGGARERPREDTPRPMVWTGRAATVDRHAGNAGLDVLRDGRVMHDARPTRIRWTRRLTGRAGTAMWNLHLVEYLHDQVELRPQRAALLDRPEFGRIGRRPGSR